MNTRNTESVEEFAGRVLCGLMGQEGASETDLERLALMLKSEFSKHSLESMIPKSLGWLVVEILMAFGHIDLYPDPVKTRLLERQGELLHIIEDGLLGSTDEPFDHRPIVRDRQLTIAVDSRRKSESTLKRAWPGAEIVDVTSKGVEPWVRFSPFYPHGGIPIPGSNGLVGQSVEGIWQGLKVFEREDIDPAKWAVKSMRGIKRSGASRGTVRGHRFGIGTDTLLSYLDARIQIYLPIYKWVLENRLGRQLDQLRGMSGTIVLLDYETNADIYDLSRPLSHAALIKKFVDDEWPI